MGRNDTASNCSVKAIPPSKQSKVFTKAELLGEKSGWIGAKGQAKVLLGPDCLQEEMLHRCARPHHLSDKVSTNRYVGLGPGTAGGKKGS